jgi:Predicted transcriptional regulators
MDLVLKLRELRRLSGLSQKDVARLSSVGEKTISSFETGNRIESLKLAQLHRILSVFGLSERDFFGEGIDDVVESWEVEGAHDMLEELRDLPSAVQNSLVEKFRLMIDAASAAHTVDPSRFSRSEMDWQILTSRN